jgi:hypothetical protein
LNALVSRAKTAYGARWFHHTSAEILETSL